MYIGYLIRPRLTDELGRQASSMYVVRCILIIVTVNISPIVIMSGGGPE